MKMKAFWIQVSNVKFKFISRFEFQNQIQLQCQIQSVQKFQVVKHASMRRGLKHRGTSQTRTIAVPVVQQESGMRKGGSPSTEEGSLTSLCIYQITHGL